MKNFEYTVLRTDEEEAEMIRKIIHIDEEKCNGCAQAENSFHGRWMVSRDGSILD